MLGKKITDNLKVGSLALLLVLALETMYLDFLLENLLLEKVLVVKLLAFLKEKT